MQINQNNHEFRTGAHKSGCGSKSFHFNHIPELSRTTFSTQANFRLTALNFFTDRTRFISCHKLDKSQFLPLIEIVTAVDVFTWMLVLILSISTLLVLNLGYSLSLSVKKPKTMDFVFEIYSTLLDQGSSCLFQGGSKYSLFQFFILFPIPLSFLVLSNEYKGDNIQRLTVSPSKIPFDTLEDLILHKFTLRTEPIKPFEFVLQDWKQRE